MPTHHPKRRYKELIPFVAESKECKSGDFHCSDLIITYDLIIIVRNLRGPLSITFPAARQEVINTVDELLLYHQPTNPSCRLTHHSLPIKVFEIQSVYCEIGRWYIMQA